jgi:hypothetical protein
MTIERKRRAEDAPFGSFRKEKNLGKTRGGAANRRASAVCR